MKKRYIFWTLGILLVAATVAGYGYFFRAQVATEAYRTVNVERGSLSSNITTNGTVNPVITVLVGSQVSGTIQKLYADFNTPVKMGQLIAQIDPATFQAQVSQAKAKVESARASILTTEAEIATTRSNLDANKANVVKAKVGVDDTRRSLDRSLELFRLNLIAASDRDAAQTAYDSALAQLEVAQAQQKAGEAQLASSKTRRTSAQAALKQTEAELEIAQVNLDHTKITAPVNGIVISRNVDVGQTVAASLQAPTLFTIAQDLTEMQVEANVSEADIGRVAEGEETTFTVDAYPQNIFRGKVTEIRNSPVTVQNVVTYVVVIRVKNPEMKLRPGMTANASILVAHRDNALKIPNAALRFRPESAKREAAASQKQSPAIPASASASTGSRNRERLKEELNLSSEQQAAIARIFQESRRETEAAGKDEEKIRQIRQGIGAKIRTLLNDEQRAKYDQIPQQPGESQASAPVYRVWVLGPQNKPVPVGITTGISDGSFTEVVSGDLKEGQPVIVETIGGNTKGGSNTSSRSGMPPFGGRR